MSRAITQPPVSGIARPMPAPKSRLAGEDADDTLIPRIHIFQGLPQERDIYGKHEPGDLINSVTKDKIASKDDLPKFVPIFGYKEWIRFGVRRGEPLHYRTRDKASVRPDDLDWTLDAAGQRHPPKATLFINWVCLIEGQESPLVLSFRTTSLNTGKTINTLEKQRGNRGPGLYALVLREKKNDKGAWLAPEVRPAGNPPDDMKALAEALFNSMSPDDIQTNIDADAGEFDPDNPPKF